MFVLGLTGSIAMGKTWGSKCFQHLGVPVHDADACVHELLGPGGAAVRAVEAAFVGVQKADGGVDRLKLADRVFGDDTALHTLEAILHPLVRQRQRDFLAVQARQATPLVVLDVPLLYETGGTTWVDAVAVMTAPAFLQRQRVLRRKGMTENKFQAILERQTPDAIKRRVADFVISTAATRGASLRQIAAVVKMTRDRQGQVWSPTWGN